MRGWGLQGSCGTGDGGFTFESEASVVVYLQLSKRQVCLPSHVMCRVRMDRMEGDSLSSRVVSVSLYFPSLSRFNCVWNGVEYRVASRIAKSQVSLSGFLYQSC